MAAASAVRMERRPQPYVLPLALVVVALLFTGTATGQEADPADSPQGAVMAGGASGPLQEGAQPLPRRGRLRREDADSKREHGPTHGGGEEANAAVAGSAEEGSAALLVNGAAEGTGGVVGGDVPLCHIDRETGAAAGEERRETGPSSSEESQEASAASTERRQETDTASSEQSGETGTVRSEGSGAGGATEPGGTQQWHLWNGMMVPDWAVEYFGLDVGRGGVANPGVGHKQLGKNGDGQLVGADGRATRPAKGDSRAGGGARVGGGIRAGGGVGEARAGSLVGGDPNELRGRLVGEHTDEWGAAGRGTSRGLDDWRRAGGGEGYGEGEIEEDAGRAIEGDRQGERQGERRVGGSHEGGARKGGGQDGGRREVGGSGSELWIEYRGLRVSDEDVIADLHGRYFPIEYEKEYYAELAACSDGCISWAAVDRRPEAAAGDSLIGLAVGRIYPTWWEEEDAAAVLGLEALAPNRTLLYIQSIVVHEAYRKLGIASTLLRRLVSFAGSLPTCKGVYLHVMIYNVGAIRLYERLGFKLRANLTDFYEVKEEMHAGLLYARYVNGGGFAVRRRRRRRAPPVIGSGRDPSLRQPDVSSHDVASERGTSGER